MNNTSLTTRRDFLITTAGVAAALGTARPSLAAATRKRSFGANDRIRIGLIGCGNRGIGFHLAGIKQHAAAANVEVVAVCDPWRIAREKAVAAVKEFSGQSPKLCRNYVELLAQPNLDAVMIASPDHVHTLHLEAAARAGKHAYVEKPMGIGMAELVRACDAVKEAGIIVQVGTQQRSEGGIVGCHALLKTGILGPISRIEQVRNQTQPYWFNYPKQDVRKEDLDWVEFTQGRTTRSFDPSLFLGWYGYYEFSQGPVPQFGSHFIDLAHYMTGLNIPETCACLGGIYTWKDERAFTAPDQVQAVWHYPEGTMVSYSTNFGNSAGNGTRIYGRNGTLRVDRRGEPVYSAEGGLKRDGTIRGENIVPAIARPDHVLDWLQCLRTGATPHAPIDAGYRHAVATIMATMSYETGRRMRYDAVNRSISPG